MPVLPPTPLHPDGHAGALAPEELERARSLERVRMADALHDDVLQRLSALRQDLCELRAAPTQERVREAERTLDGALEAVRSVTCASHDDALAAMPLRTAVGHVVDDIARRTRLVPEVRVADVDLGPGTGTFVLRAIRELTANVAAHAGADRVAVRVAVEDGTVHVEVSDDGVGTTAPVVARRADEGHLGLALLRRRALERGGTFALTSDGATGTTVSLAIPLAAPGPEG